MIAQVQKLKIPTRPGCYLYKNAKGEVIYVGKAKNLRNRIKSYLNKSLDDKTKLLVSKVRDVEFITTNNEVEALLLEQSLIHKYQPKFNINLKGGIRYAYIKITDEKFPRIVTSRKIGEKGEYYGPYTDGTMRRQVINTLVKVFKIRTCVKLPKKVCLQYHIGNCLGPCENLISYQEYQDNIDSARKFLKGQSQEIIINWTERMKEASAQRNFELAKIYRDQIKALSFVQDKQHVDQPKNYDQDVINWIIQDKKIHFQVFNISKGVITSRHKFTLDNFFGVVEDFIKHFYSIHYIPNEIIIPQKINDQTNIKQYLQTKKKEKFTYHYLPQVKITIPQKGSKKELLTLVKDNLELNVGMEPGILELQQKLQLSKPPLVIDFFDISNLKNKYIVGASIQIVNGKFYKNHYRKFKVKWSQTQDDFASMREIVYRRYRDLLKKGQDLPDLICIDGGRGQLNSALQALAKLELKIDICALAKKEEELYLPGKAVPLRLNKSLPGLNILIKGRDEVHRFALAYNRQLRRRGLKNS